MNEKQLAIVETEWRRIAPRLLTHVRWKIGYGLLPKGHDAEDVVQMAFERLLAGSRSWDPDKIDLETHMKQSILRSMLGSKGLPTVKDAGGGEFTDEEDLGHLNSAGIHSRDAQRDAISEMDKAEAFNLLGQEVQEDEELRDVLEAIRMGCSKPAEIAAITGFEVKRVYWLMPKLAGYTTKVGLKMSGRGAEGRR